MNTESQKGIGSPVIMIIVLLVLIVGGAYYMLNQQQDGEVIEKDVEDAMDKMEPTEDAMMKKVDDEMMKGMMSMTYEYSGQLADVTDGNDVRGINTGGNSSGVARASFKDGSYMLLATFENLPDPAGTDFYEGWVVRKGENLSVISTGKAEKTVGKYSNTYSSGSDLTDHTFCVLTIEPDDGDPAPADHILEGTMVK